MAISRTPKRVVEQQFDAPVAQTFEDVDGEDNRNDDIDEVADLKAKLAELQEQVNDRTNDLPYLQAPTYQSQVSPQAPVDVDVNTIKLPDPVQFPDEYADAVERRAELRLVNKQRKQEFDARQKTNLDNKLGELWADFGTDYPEMAENKDRIDFIAQKLAVQAAQRGVDPQHYMFNTRNRFMKDVAKLYVSTFGDPAENGQDIDDDPPARSRKTNSSNRRRASNRDREEEDNSRSSGIFGGNESGGRPSRRGVEDETDYSMLDDIHAMQKKSGFF